MAAGSPVAPAALVGLAATSFAAAARAAGRRVCFFAVERPLPGFQSLVIGEQPILEVPGWPGAGARFRGLREQVRRARRKGVRIWRVPAAALAPGSHLRARLERLAAEHGATRHLEPLGFFVSSALFLYRDSHRYYVAERDGRIVALLSAVPAFGGEGWLVDDVLRSREAPNGTAESLLVALVAEVPRPTAVTLGLTPLSGPIPSWLRAASHLGRPLYDFGGLRAFRERLHPSRWEPVFLALPARARPAVHVRDSLVAFADGSPIRFLLRTLVRRPSGFPWALSLGLAAWTALLAASTLLGSRALGLSRAALSGGTAFDACFALWLFRLARRPRWPGLALAAGLAGADGAAYGLYLSRAGHAALGPGAWMRAFAVAGPAAAACALAWGARLARGPSSRGKAERALDLRAAGAIRLDHRGRAPAAPGGGAP